MLGWLRKTLGAQQPKKIGDVFDAYGQILEHYPGAILDASMLPLPKTEMKALLKTVYARASDLAERNIYANAFIFLSHFQNGVGQKPVSAPASVGNIEYIKDKFDAKMEILDRWIILNNLAAAESAVLQDEWKRFLGGEPI